MHRPTSITLLLITLLLGGCGRPAAGQPPSNDADVSEPRPATDVGPVNRLGTDWPQFLGPRRDGTTPEPLSRTNWNETPPDVAWSRPIGEGYAAPSVVGNRVVVFHRRRDEEVIECVRADTGQTLWESAAATDFRDPYGYNGGPRAAPLIVGDRVVTFGAGGRLRASDLAGGETLWERDTAAEFEIPPAFFGVGCAPVAEDGTLFVAVGGQPDAGLVAMDIATGQTRWTAVGRDTWDGVETGLRRSPNYEWTGDEMLVSYSSPILATIHDRRHLLLLGRQGLVSVDPTGGAVNFRYWFRSSTHESVNAATPVVVGDTILLSAPYGVGAVCLRVAEDGRSVSELWRRRRGGLETHWSTAVYYKAHYYGFSGRNEGGATLMCVDARTGETVWETDGFDGELADIERTPGGYRDVRSGQSIPFPFFGRGSLTLCGDVFVALGERGTLATVRPSSEGYREIARVAAPGISYSSWAAPVYSRGRLFLRDEDTLLALDVGPSEAGDE